jgi:hypothetical protein
LVLPPTLAALQRDARWRERARALHLPLGPLAGIHHGARCLDTLFAVLEGERLLVLVPAAGRALRVRVAGLADVFQLHTLLADALHRWRQPGFLAWLSFWRTPLVLWPPDPLAVEVARGTGPQEGAGSVKGVWNLYAWTALGPDGRLRPELDEDDVVWNEGRPADIPAFEGTRVLLLGPPAYPRAWSNTRFFSALPAEVVVEAELPGDEAAGWLGRLGAAAAARSSPPPRTAPSARPPRS